VEDADLFSRCVLKPAANLLRRAAAPRLDDLPHGHLVAAEHRIDDAVLVLGEYDFGRGVCAEDEMLAGALRHIHAAEPKAGRGSQQKLPGDGESAAGVLKSRAQLVRGVVGPRDRIPAAIRNIVVLRNNLIWLAPEQHLVEPGDEVVQALARRVIDGRRRPRAVRVNAPGPRFLRQHITHDLPPHVIVMALGEKRAVPVDEFGGEVGHATAPATS